MRRASYRAGIAWIAANDEPGDLEAASVGDSVSVLLLADLFHVDPARVARDVVRARAREEAAS